LATKKTTHRVVKACLVTKAAESAALNPRWIVNDEDKAWAEQAAYESSLGEVLGPGPGDSPTSTATTVVSTNSTVLPAKNASRKREAAVTPENHSNKEVAEANETKKPRKTVTFEETTGTTASESDTSHKKAAASAREERSRRRQAALQEQKSAKLLIHTSQMMRRRKPDNRRSHKKKAVARDDDDDKNVVRVPMLTGTLFLYKGPNARAVFVRSV
jgi:hypothetical protein